MKRHEGFTLVELVTVLVLVGILSVTLFNRVGGIGSAAVQGSRDDLIAALFFAQQTAMARSGSNRAIRLQIMADQITVTEIVTGAGASTKVIYNGAAHHGATFSPAAVRNYDKLGRTLPLDIAVTGSGNSAGVSAAVRLEGSGYAFAN